MKLEPTTLILFGITGDLSQKKILPALYDMYKKSSLPKDFNVVGFSRREFSDEEIRKFVVENLTEMPDRSFLEKFYYVQGQFDKGEDYLKLGRHLVEIDQKFKGCTNKLFYLSTPPDFYETISLNLSNSGLSIPCGGKDGFARVLLEKPFGRDLETAQKLDSLLAELFQENQIYRIDHYLAKESLFKIIDLHRQNELISSRWNRENILKVEIKVYEKKKIDSRGNFYDGVGALRDIGQNHLLQMLALVAMDIPEEKSSENIKKEREKVLKKLKPFEGKIETGQYEGYLNEKGVLPDSNTETFFKMTVFVDSSKFFNVPFELSSGKALCEDLTEIVVIFKDGLRIVFYVPKEDSLPAYERVLLDAILGDQTVFISTEEVLAQWDFITPIEEKIKYQKPFIYKEGMNPKNF